MLEHDLGINSKYSTLSSKFHHFFGEILKKKRGERAQTDPNKLEKRERERQPKAEHDKRVDLTHCSLCIVRFKPWLLFCACMYFPTGRLTVPQTSVHLKFI